MITNPDQMQLFSILAQNLKSDSMSYAFGGTAMMFYGYKDETKNIDLVFEENDDRQVFIAALTVMGFKETSPLKIYIPDKLRDKHRPLMYIRQDIRFDLFSHKIFQTLLSPKMRNDLFAVHEFRGKKILKLNVLRKEQIVLLKAVTEREKDQDDIMTIIKNDKTFDWQYLINEALWQHAHGDSWVILDLEKTMRELKKFMFIEKKYFDSLYRAIKK